MSSGVCSPRRRVVEFRWPVPGTDYPRTPWSGRLRRRSGPGPSNPPHNPRWTCSAASREASRLMYFLGFPRQCLELTSGEPCDGPGRARRANGERHGHRLARSYHEEPAANDQVGRIARVEGAPRSLAVDQGEKSKHAAVECRLNEQQTATLAELASHESLVPSGDQASTRPTRSCLPPSPTGVKGP